MKSEEFLERIRTAAGLRRAVLQKITVEGTQATFHLATDLHYSPEDEKFADEVAQAFVPEGFSGRAHIVKFVPDEESIRRKIAEILRRRFPAAAAFLSPQDIQVIKDEGGGRFFIDAGNAERAQFDSGEILDALNAELQKSFCGTYFGNVRTVDRDTPEMEREEIEPAEIVLAPRSFPVTGYEPIDGAKPSYAIYMADLTAEAAGVSVCGRVTYVQEKQTSKGKPYFSFSLTDGSAQLRVNYFTKKATVEKVREIKQGDHICLTGDNELFNGGLSFRAKAVDFGAPPEGFVPEARPSRPVPAKYKAVFPEPASDMRQATMFGERQLPPAFAEHKFVVFDLETTGLNNTPAAGAMDRIIEVGAVKIEGGQISEKFSTFVACPVRLSAEIVSLTGIDDAMLVGAPAIGDVVADFYKFCDGCILVGHNVQFDYKFIRYYGEKEGYIFDHKQYDTLALAQELLFLSNYKLNTLADHYGFTFNHHRAYDDAFVTAKIFIELIKEKKCLPN